MRGGDSLMSWISRLNGVIWNIRHSSNCIRQPTVRCPSSVFFGNRFRSADCQKIQLPLGGSRGEEAIRFYHSSNRSVSWASGGFYPPLQMAFSTQRTAQSCQLRASAAASTASKCFADYQLLCELLILRLEIRIFYGYNSVCVFCNR